jgi:predicted CxxxxCH...CXXCH cytochrome family protein
MKSHISFLTLVAVGATVLWGGCAELKDGLPPPVEAGAQVHLPSWVDATSANFHGSAANQDMKTCLKCHGSDFNGGSSKVSCIACHNQAGANIHGRGWETPSSPNFHGKYIASKSWDMRPCQPCHGTSYTGGSTPVPCTTCHTQVGGPENCATCHGTANPAPPRDLSGNTVKTARGVGAHQIHYIGSSLAGAMYCNDCHVVPGPTYAPGHIDNSPNAEVLINSPIARVETNKPGTPNYSPSLPRFSPSPVYDAATLKCSSTYCHGNFKNGNTTFAPVWNDATGSQMACGTCHGDVSRPTALERSLPKTAARGGTHPTLPQGWTCANCHGEVVNSSTQIINPTKHMNGKLNIGPNEIDY